MAAATVTTKVYENDHDPGKETVVLTATDGETYVSTKFAVILGAQATGNENIDAHLNATFSGQTATINYAGQTDKKVTLTLWGRK